MQAQRNTASRTLEAADILLPDTASRRRFSVHNGEVQIEDAVFEVVGSPSVRQRQPRHNSFSMPTGNSADALTLVERQLSKLSVPAFSTFLISAFFLVFWYCGGFGVLSASRVTPPALLDPFLVSDIRTSADDANGMKVLSVVGSLTNQSGTFRPLPALRVASTDGKIQFGRITLRPGGIAPSGTIRFSGKFKLAVAAAGEVAITPEI